VHAVEPERRPEPIVEERTERLLRLPDLGHRDRAVGLARDVQDRPRRRIRVHVERSDDLVVRLRVEIRVVRHHRNRHANSSSPPPEGVVPPSL
jgi:hypothetical protein